MLATIQLTEVLAWLTLLVGFPLSVVTTLLLRKKHREAPDLKVLRERYIASTIMSIATLFFGLVFVQNDQVPPPLNLDMTKWITRLTILALAIIPSVLWIRLYRSMRRPKEKEDP